MRLQNLMKRDLLSLNAKLDLIGSKLAPLSKQLDQFAAKLCVSALLLREQVTAPATVSNDVTLTEVFFAVHKLRLNLTVLVPS